MKKLIMGLMVVGLLMMAGCNATGKVYKDGELAEKIPQDVGVTRALAPMAEACPDELPPETFKPQVVSSDCNDPNLKEMGQVECFQTNQVVAISNGYGSLIFEFRQQMAPKEKSCAEAVADIGVAYFEKEGIQAGEMGKTGRSGVAWIMGAFGLKWLADGYGGASDAGSTYNVTGLTQTKSDDPSVNGEGGGSTGGIGGQIINIGSGVAGTDKAIPFVAEKGIGFSGDSNMDADGGGGVTGVTLDDPDGNNSRLW